MAKDTTPPPERLAEIELVTRRAQAGDEGVVPRLRELLDEFPRLAAYHGDLANSALAAWISLAAGGNALLRESLSVKVGTLRSELAGESPDPVLELAADRVVVSWMAANYTAAAEAAALATNENSRLVAHRTKRRLQAERAHLGALAALVTLRKLLPRGTGRSRGETPALPRHADADAVNNRLAGFFGDLSLFPAARKDAAVVN